jgi:arylsulfatase A-like enzyme
MVDPELQSGVQCEQPLSLLDIMPTFLQATDIQPIEDYGRSSLGILLQELWIGISFTANIIGTNMAFICW